MSDTFLIKNTANTLLFSIKPGALDGPSGAARHTDLRLYGLGVGDWGEGVDQNLYHLLEHSACPAKVLGDYNPATGLFDYNPAIHPILPKSEQDLGPGNGITTPVLGQLWFNTTNQHLYSKRASGWVSMAGGVGSDLDAEYLGGIPAADYALITYNDSSNAATLTSAEHYTDQQITTLSNHVTDLDTAQTLALTTHVNTTTLSVHGSSISAGANTLMHRDANGRSQVTAPSVGNDIVNKTYADAIQTYATGVQTNLTTHVNLTGSGGAHGATSSATANSVMARDANGRSQVATPVANADAANKQYVDGLLASTLSLPLLITCLAYGNTAIMTALASASMSSGVTYTAGGITHMYKNVFSVGGAGNVMVAYRALFPGTYRFYFEYSAPDDYSHRFQAAIYVNGVRRGYVWDCDWDAWHGVQQDISGINAGDLVELRTVNNWSSSVNVARNFRVYANTALPGNLQVPAVISVTI